MIILRAIKKSDLEKFIELANQETFGITTLPHDNRILEQKLFSSIDSFRKAVNKPDNEFYLFALEDTHTDELIGISAIAATTGGNDPLYFFRHETLNVESTLMQTVKKIPILTPISYVRGPSEVCSLYLNPNYRKKGLGKLLSLGRFLFIAKFPERFTNIIIAELRGKIDNNNSIFWNGVGRHFFDVSIEEALNLLKFGRSFITHFLPKHPIYISLLPEEVQSVIGQTHPQTSGALALLLQQGFEITDEIDIFDGGPKLKVLKNDVRTVRESSIFQVIEISDNLNNAHTHLLSNEKIDFRATLGDFIPGRENICKITSDAAEALQVGLGDYIRSCPLKG